MRLITCQYFWRKGPQLGCPAQTTGPIASACNQHIVTAVSSLQHLNSASCPHFQYVPKLIGIFCVQEKHLVMAMTTQQLQGQTGDTIIPTPNVITDISHYDQVYNRDALRSVQYIRMSGSYNVYNDKNNITSQPIY